MSAATATAATVAVGGVDPSALAAALARPDDPATLRALLRGAAERHVERFWSGAPAAELVTARTGLVDRVLVGLWERFFADAGGRLALFAVGGYGRGELHPGSDVDIMLLADEAVIAAQKHRIEAFSTLLWDIGLEVGQSVRTLDDCERESRADVTVLTNLSEARLLAGDEALAGELDALLDPARLWSNRAFFEAKKAEQKQRYHKYDETAYNLEPNVKEGSGGLRDIQTVAWVAKRYFGADTLHELVGHGFLTEPEYRQLAACQDFLWQVRYGLHALAGRREDRLLFEYQRQLATRFGYSDSDANLAVEQLMQRYYRTIMAIGRLNEMLLQHFEEAILLADDVADPVPINRRFRALKGFLEVTHENVFRRNPFALLELFLTLQQHKELNGVRATTVRLVCDSLHLIDDRFRADVRARSLFMEILRQPDRVTRALRRMNRYGVLGAYLPEWAGIVGRMQYDLFHVYTVDQHTLFVVRNLRRFDLERFADESPHCSEVMRHIPKPDLLYVAALYHDIGKGRGGDHSELGAVDAAKFCERHGLSRFDGELVPWLVKHHLAMSLTAQKKDIHDPDVVSAFAQFVANQLRLDYLYLLTVADIRATNPKLWNTWRAALLKQLYDGARGCLRRGLANPQDRAERSRETRDAAVAELARLGIDRARAEAIWRQHSDDYFLRYRPDEIVWHTRAILKKADDDRALVLSRDDPERGATELFLYLRDIGGIFATVAATLDRLGLSVHDARIMTGRDGYVLDSFTVLDASGRAVGVNGGSRSREIAERLSEQLNRPELGRRELDVNRRTPRVLKQFDTPTSISLENDASRGHTLLELVTADRPGLLSRIGRAFIDCGVQLVNARIATIGERAEDIFSITDRDGRPLDEVAQRALRESLLKHLAG